MSYDLSFSEDFFTGEGYESPSKRSTNVMQALESMAKFDRKEFDEMLGEVLGAKYKEVWGGGGHIGETVFQELLDKVRKTNTCSSLSSPVPVWIDEHGDYKVDVYDSKKTASIHGTIRHFAEALTDLPLFEDSRLKTMLKRVIDPLTKGLFSEEYWKPIKDIKAAIQKIIPLQEIEATYAHEGNKPKSKHWVLVGPYKNNAGATRVCWVQISANGAGSIEDPLDKYDVTVQIEMLSPKSTTGKVREYLTDLGIKS
jgi:hypothetical protein